MATEHVDVLIVGAGLSGIGAARHLQMRCPNRRFAIFEGRDRIGGTWDLFRYPGVRSDSDMHTLGYSFKPWALPQAIADGPSILRYVQETAAEFGIERHIRFRHRVVQADWSSADARWTVDAEHDADGNKQAVTITCSFLLLCAGYYNYEAGFTPEFPHATRFRGRVVHPQFWTEDIEYANRRVVVIGSGATAVTLVPELAKRAAHVTLLQRSPTYMVSQPAEDALANAMSRVLPTMLAYHLTRWKRVLLGLLVFRLCRAQPVFAKAMMLRNVRARVGADYDLQMHFTPRYNPWEQRVCLVPDGDLFEAIKDHRVSVVTDHIQSFTETGIALQSGAELAADLIVTATGLNLQVMGGLRVRVDGKTVDVATTLNYKGVMFSGIPNLASCFGYTNAAWTLKCDLISQYVCRLLNYMQRHQLRQCAPRAAASSASVEPWVDFSSGYFARSLHLFPRQGSRAPWKLYQNYLRDYRQLRFGRIADGVLELS